MTRFAFAPLLILLGLASFFPATVRSEGFQRALPGFAYEFPRDHGSHPDFQTEWWYFTGNLETESGRPFGYELTIFRTGLIPPGDPRAGASPLVPSNVFLGHFAISDITNEAHENWEAVGREGLGQAHGATDRLDVRVGDLAVRMEPDETILLTAEVEGAALDFRLSPAKPFVIHGENGVHQKASDPGQASHYITYTRLNTEGTLTWRGEDYAVRGLSWFDHEFGSDQLSGEEVGWDWFALQLANGEDLMVYGLRRADGTFNPQSIGTLVGPGGEKTLLPKSAYDIRPTGTWTSPHTGAVYPMGWEIEVPQFDGALRVLPRFEDQEMLTEQSTGTNYWEGAVTVEGTWRGAPATGKGYVELVGYDKVFDRL
ncbi:MAG: lipocalin-like domain-containing protein [Sumerlaeia bacterium]